MRSRPDWEDDDGAGAGQDLFATALIAMILITAAFLMEIGHRKVKTPEKLPEGVQQEWRLMSDGQYLAVSDASCVANIPGNGDVDAYTPFGYQQIKRPSDRAGNALILSSQPVWVEQCP